MIKSLVSIIVPVYNAAEYLQPCLESMANQSYPLIEVWLINDGSTDNSLEICREFAKKDNRFKVINKKNSGVSATRNMGIKKAKGRYIFFADSDDYLAPNAIKVLVDTMAENNADLVVAHFYRVNGKNKAKQGHIKENLLLTRDEYAKKMMKAPANFYYGVLWNKFYRADIIKENKLFFEADHSWCEDFLFNLEYLKFALIVATTTFPVYYYFKREGSLVSTQITVKKTIAVKKSTFLQYKELYKALDIYDNKKLTIYRYLVTPATDASSIDVKELPQNVKERIVAGNQKRVEKRDTKKKIKIAKKNLDKARREEELEVISQKIMGSKIAIRLIDKMAKYREKSNIK